METFTTSEQVEEYMVGLEEMDARYLLMLEVVMKELGVNSYREMFDILQYTAELNSEEEIKHYLKLFYKI